MGIRIPGMINTGKRRLEQMKRDKFTLVELLIIIAIIAILAAMLLPALNKALGKAQGIQCLSNQKQIGSYIACYIGDNAEWYPLAEFRHPTYGTITSWVTLLAEYKFTKEGQWEIFNNRVPYFSETGYLEKRRKFAVFACPRASWIYSDDFRPGLALANKVRATNYSCNFSLFGNLTDATHKPRRSTLVNHPSRSGLIFDGDVHNYGPSNNYYIRLDVVNKGIDYRHSNFCNTLFADGHASALQRSYYLPVAFGQVNGVDCLFQ